MELFVVVVLGVALDGRAWEVRDAGVLMGRIVRVVAWGVFWDGVRRGRRLLLLWLLRNG